MPPTNLSKSVHRIERDAGRLREIVTVLVKYGFSDWLEKVPFPGIQGLLQRAEPIEARNLTHEERVRLALTELGTTFIKLGQILSTRADLVGVKLANELSKLQSQTPPDPPEVVIPLIEQELGHPIEELFESFETESFASASVAQVHRAVLFSGELVAVKVQKEGILAKVEADLSILESIARFAESHSSKLKDYSPLRVVSEFRRTILNELDAFRERHNMEVFARNFDGDDRVHFPRSWGELSSRRVLTMEYMDGYLVRDVALLEESGEAFDEFSRIGATVYLDMIFRDSFYHADPHPGNLMVLPGGNLGILDCGMVGRVDEGLREDLESLMLAVTQNDVEVLTDTLWSLTKGQPPKARQDLQADLNDLLADSIQDSSRGVDLSAILTGLLDIFRRYRVAIRPGLSSLLRTLVLLDGTSRLLNPQFSLAEVMRPYQEKIIRQRFAPKTLAKRLQKHYVEWDRIIETLPRDINLTLAKVRSGEARVVLEHRHLDAVVNRLVLGIVASSLFLGSSLLWSMKAAPLIYGVSVFGAIGYGVAIVLGWTLYRAIRRSGKIAPKE